MSRKIESVLIYVQDLATATCASSADALPWSWKEYTLLRVYEAYEFVSHFAPRSEKSAERFQKVDLKYREELHCR